MGREPELGRYGQVATAITAISDQCIIKLSYHHVIAISFSSCSNYYQLNSTNTYNIPPELRLASALKLETQLFSHIFTSTFVTLAKKKVKRQCSSKTVMNSKATAEVPKQDRE